MQKCKKRAQNLSILWNSNFFPCLRTESDNVTDNAADDDDIDGANGVVDVDVANSVVDVDGDNGVVDAYFEGM